MWRNIASNAVTFLVVALFLLGGLIVWGKTQYTTEGPLDQAICLQVDRGSNMKRVSVDLAEKGAVSSARMFRVGADYADKTSSLKAGSYLVEGGASMEQIVYLVTKGGANTCGIEVVYRIGINRVGVQVRELDPATGRYVEKIKFSPATDEAPSAFAAVKDKADTRFRVALAEGVTSWQVVNSLKSIDVLKGEVAEVPAEGTLGPDSYEVKPGDERAGLLARMQDQQARWIADAWEGRNSAVPVDNPEDLLILASLIEKETGVAREREQVASVFVNRLNKNMRLQTDPTVIYGITKGEGILGRGLRRSELRAETPWNTYVIPALPPTPIANPGRASLLAAANPDETPYIFFVADGTGGHAFAVTLEEHNRNVAKWRKIEAEKKAVEGN
ncbi:endolytic transglycosylase MltG [Ascidiaceihabitans sp.]|nr:endolytic transglycosylase MltG [Ascidiaceihabitans sp.]